MELSVAMKTTTVLFIAALISFGISAQPSGGPYGPVPQKYGTPNVPGMIYYVSPEGDVAATGNKINKPTTIEAAIERTKSGDAIVLRGGTYRTGNLLLNQGITIQAYSDELPVLKGTKVANNWQKLRNGLWATEWEHLFPSEPADWWNHEHESRKTPLHRFNDDMVFIDGKFLQSVGWQGELDPNSFFIDYEKGIVYIATDPTDKLVEITANNVALHLTSEEVHGKTSDGKGPVIRGITFTQYAYRAIEIDGINPEGISDEKDHGNLIVGTVFEHCEISFCSRVAGYFRGDNMVFRNCKISDTSTEGLFILSSDDVLLENNIIARNNIENITGYFPAAVKIFNQCYRTVCRNNLVIDHPNSNGIWYDVGNVDGIFVNNLLERVGSSEEDPITDNLWPSRNAFFFEISKGVICAGNVFVDCDHGLLILNSSDARIYNNTFINSTACIGRNERVAEGDHFGWHASSGPDIDKRHGHEFVNNLMYFEDYPLRPHLFVWQADTICDLITDSQLAKLDNNVYVRGIHSPAIPLIIWAPNRSDKCSRFFSELTEFKNTNSDYAANSKLFDNYRQAIFRSRELGNFDLLEVFREAIQSAELPNDIRQSLNIPETESIDVGANF